MMAAHGKPGQGQGRPTPWWSRPARANPARAKTANQTPGTNGPPGSLTTSEANLTIKHSGFL